MRITTETNSKGDSVTVEWEKGQMFDDAGDGHCFMYEATGMDENETSWIGTWIEVDGEFSDIEDIEEVEF